MKKNTLSKTDKFLNGCHSRVIMINGKNKLAFVLILAYTLAILGFASACHCGDGVINQANETCDNGILNGQVCSPLYGSSCTYCSSLCKNVTLNGPYCGDNTCNGNETCSTCPKDCGTCPVQVCHIELTKSADKTDVKPGDIVTYTLHYKNTGNGACTGGGVEIQDTLDKNLNYRGSFTKNLTGDTDGQGINYGWSDTPGYNEITNTLTWNANIVSPGEEGTITFEVRVLTPTNCGDFKILNFFKAWSNEENWKSSNTINLNVDYNCPTPQPYCGDGKINQANETCDDGNTVNGDGCSSTCKIETCPTCGSCQCLGCENCFNCSNCINTKCGNGVLDPGEQCDDGNLNNFDGCSRVCTLEKEKDNVTNSNSFVQFCDTNWICSGWSECSNGVMTRSCIDNNNCDTEYNKPSEKTGCSDKVLSNVYVAQENTNYLWLILVVILFVLLLIVIINLLK